jgi:hypothetical protein
MKTWLLIAAFVSTTSGKYFLTLPFHKPAESRRIAEENNIPLQTKVFSGGVSLAAISDPQIGPMFASFDDVTLRLTPDSWISWDMSVLDKQAFGGRLGATPGYLLPLD